MSLAWAIASPHGLEARGRATLVALPGAEGDFGVLEGHAPVVALLRMGVVSVEAEDGAHRRWFVRAGAARARADRVDVIVDDALDWDATDWAALERRLADAREDAAHAAQDTERGARAREDVAWLEAALSARGGA